MENEVREPRGDQQANGEANHDAWEEAWRDEA